MSVTSEPMTGSQRAIWAIVVLVIVALVIVRSMIGTGMGRVYVEQEDMAFVQLAASVDDATESVSEP
jgi:hypothetical protein